MLESAADTGKIARSAGTVSVAVMCSRVLGLVREQTFAILFGAGFAYDAFVVAFRIPNLLRDLFAEGALSAAFVSVFKDYDTNRGAKESWELASNVLVFFGILLSLITLVGIFAAEDIVRLMAGEFQQVDGKVELTTLLTRIMFPFLVFISLAAVVMGVLNSKGRFFVPAMASSFFNLGSIIGGVGLAFALPLFGQPAIVGMALGTLIGGMLQLLWQLPALVRTGYVFRFRLQLKDPGLKRVLRLMIPAVIGLSATQINIFVNTGFAASCAQGSVSWLHYGFRLVQLPIGLFGVAIAIASLPVIAGYAAEKNIRALKETYVSSLILAFSLTLPATVGLILLAGPIVRLIFEHGNFTAADTLRTAEALSFYALGLFAYGAVKIIVPVFYTLDDTRWPVIGSFGAVAGNIVIILLTIDHFQHRAIALATSCAMIINFLLLSVVLYHKVQGYSLRYLAGGLGKILIAALAMGIFLETCLRVIWPQSPAGTAAQAVQLLCLISVATVFYAIILHFLQVKEFQLIIGKLKNRLRRHDEW